MHFKEILPISTSFMGFIIACLLLAGFGATFCFRLKIDWRSAERFSRLEEVRVLSCARINFEAFCAKIKFKLFVQICTESQFVQIFNLFLKFEKNIRRGSSDSD